MRRGLPLLGLLLGAALVALAALRWLSAAPELPGELPGTAIPAARLDAALERGFAALRARTLHADEVWVATQAAHLLGGDVWAWARGLEPPAFTGEFGSRVDRAFWTLRHDRPPALPRLPPPTHTAPVHNANPQDLKDQRAAVDLFLGLVRCAERLPRGGDVLLRAADRYGIGGYLPTHQLAFLVIGRGRGCIDAGQLARFREPLARRIHAEMLGESVPHDLQIERAMVLCHAGLCAWVGDAQLEQILGGQAESGLWPDGMEPAHIRDEHATAFALYVLAAKRTGRVR